MDKKEIIAARLAEWGLELSERELEQLVPAYDNLLIWQQVVEDMLRARPMAGGISFPESEPVLTPPVANEDDATR